MTDLERAIMNAKAAGESVCLGCGCTDSHACAEGCSWILVSRRRGIGVCSQCEVSPGARVPMGTHMEAAGLR